jgi:hypothetical protein
MSDGAAWMGASLPKVIGGVRPALAGCLSAYPIFSPGPDRLCNETGAISTN